MSELADSLRALGAALREQGEEGRARWIAERATRADEDPDGVRADVRRVLAGMGGIHDLWLDRELVARVQRAIGDHVDEGRPRRMIPARPGGPIRP